MTEPAPLTDEELAEMWEAALQIGGSPLPPETLRLIADLRAARAEVERVRLDLARTREEALRRGQRLVDEGHWHEDSRAEIDAERLP